MLKKIICTLLILAVMLGLCGCNPFTAQTDELLSPPRLTGDMYPIQQALEKSIDGPYTLRYISQGNLRTAVILEDIDGDGFMEAFVFYSTSDGEQTTMHINVICYRNKKWVSVDTDSIIAGDVDRVNLGDLDGDGIMEIIVGWEIYAGSEKRLTVYSLSAGTLIQRMQQQYTYFLSCDLDQNLRDELFVQYLNTTDATNNAWLYSFDSQGVTQIGGCLMDGSVKTANEPILSTLSTGQPAIYIDEIKGIGAVTEVLYYTDGELVNTLLDTENSLENTKTLRASALLCKDIDNDGVPEIPIATELPSAELVGAEKIYYTHWCAFDGEILTVKQVSLMNVLDGYRINIPDRWMGKISMLKDAERRIRAIYVYNPETEESGSRIITFRAAGEKDYDDKDFDRSNTLEILRNNGTVYYAIKSLYAGDLKVSDREITQMFELFEY